MLGARVAGRPAAVLLAALVAGCAAAGDWPPAPWLEIVPDVDAGPLPPSVQAEAVRSGLWRCTFRFEARPAAPDGGAVDAPGAPPPRVLTLAGTFNGWNPGATPMQALDAGRAWSATVELPAGVHEYKFVADGARWLPDPRNPESVDDNRGGRNSVLRLGYVAHARAADVQLGDGRIEGRGLEHDPGRPLYLQALGGGRGLLRLRTLAGDVERAWVAVRGGGLTEMTVVAPGPPCALWEALVAAEAAAGQRGDPADGGPRGGPTAWSLPEYTFVLEDGPLRAAGPATYGGVSLLENDRFRTPDWAKHAVWYQVFLDRFRNGDPSNDHQPVRPWTSEWFTLSPWEQERAAAGETFYQHIVFDRQYGGDLQGLIEKLPYLKELGVNALYLNPVFKAESNHKYNAETYLHVDDHFGFKGDYDEVAASEDHNDPATWKWTRTDRLFLEFLRQAHAQGFKVILDGVFNHVGTAHPAFQDVKRNGPESKYADWFAVTSWEPFRYEGWFGHEALPVFRKSPDGLASPQVKAHIFNVTRRWMDPDGDGDPRDGIDGWRLDVPNEIPAPFWVEWRRLVKSLNPDAYISGEIWERADLWLDGRHFDAVMNYEFARAAVAWIFNRRQKIGVSEIDQRLRELRLAYPLEATLALQNLLDSHDTDRVASMARNPDRAYDQGNRVQDNGPDYDNSKPAPVEYARVRLAVLLQMTYVGAPMIYYGDEAGMWGADDPTCRKPMLWEDLEPYDKPEENFVMRDHLAFYRRAIALRRAHPALRTGTFRTLLADDEQDVWAFLRKDADEQLVVVLNAAGRERVATVPLPPGAPNEWTRVFGAEGRTRAADHKLQVSVPGISGVVLHAATPR